MGYRANFILATHAGNLVGWIGRMRGLHMVSDRAERFYQPRIGQASNQHATGDRDKRHQNQQQLSCEIDPAQYGPVLRSEERRVGKGGGRTCRSWWAAYN